MLIKLYLIEASQNLRKTSNQFETEEKFISKKRTRNSEAEYNHNQSNANINKINENVNQENFARQIQTRQSSKKKDIYKETIEKLTAAHINGFEPVFIIKTKIITKIQKKYLLDDNIVNDLRDKIFTDLIEDEDDMVTKRNKEQQIVN